MKKIWGKKKKLLLYANILHKVDSFFAHNKNCLENTQQ